MLMAFLEEWRYNVLKKDHTKELVLWCGLMLSQCCFFKLRQE